VTRTEPPATVEESSIVAKLSTLDRFLAVWILIAMAVGIGLGRAIPGLNDALAKVEIGGVSLPIALGLLIMMYPVLAKVRYDKLGHVTGDRGLMAPRWSSTGSSARR
jgi:ACR3 family arsenite transporter